MPQETPPAQEPRLDRIQRTLSNGLARLRDSVRDSRAKELLMLTLPYQLAAILTALVAVGYALLFEMAEEANAWILQRDPDLLYLTAPAAFLVSWWLVWKLAPMAAGSGIPQLMAAIEVARESEKDRSWRFLNLRIILVKVASSMAMVLGGGAVGREGPTLQISGSVYRLVHRILPPFWPKVSRRVMMITGGAAGLGAAFNTPLGGIVFAVEELTKTHIAQFRTAVLSATILSGMTAQWLNGPYLGPFLGYPKVSAGGFSFMYKVLTIALIAGLCGALFCKGLLLLDGIRRKLRNGRALALYTLAAAALFILCLKIFGMQGMGSGKHLLEHYLFEPQVNPSWKDIPARILGSLFSASAGGAGGIFAPSLSSGAAVGGYIAQFFEATRSEFNVLVLAGMTAFLTGVSRSPFTSAILVLEMTDRHSVIFQLMYAAMIAFLVANLIDRKSFYERMKLRLLAALPDWKPEEGGAPADPSRH
ncbi:MAG: chloride channel protein [Flavobacteriales bacterium]|nr:chloride channel protein [Flavobacteriales bacterium]